MGAFCGIYSLNHSEQDVEFPVCYFSVTSGVLYIEEQDSLRSQFVTLKNGQHSKYPPFAFTEQGVAMLSSVLNSDRAITANIAITRTFTRPKDDRLARRPQMQNRGDGVKIRQTISDCIRGNYPAY